jgi:hypothetical protein
MTQAKRAWKRGGHYMAGKQRGEEMWHLYAQCDVVHAPWNCRGISPGITRARSNDANIGRLKALSNDALCRGRK